MHLRSWLLAGALAGSVTTTAWLWMENRSLRAELSGMRNPEPRPAEAEAVAVIDRARPEPSHTPSARPRADAPPVPGQWSVGDRPERPTPPAEAPEETREQRRKRRQQKIAAIFGRLDGETEAEYTERVRPLVEMALSEPRTRLEDARRAAEEAAQVTDEQREKLDSVVQDAFSEAIALTNKALESGDLTPYSRNWSGVLNVAGGLGAILEGSEARIGDILSRDQVQTIYDEGFEWGEYLGVSVPWEQLQPPPPPGDDER